MARIELIREEADRLKCQKWEFDTYAAGTGAIKCLLYGVLERPTTRHKYVVKAKWERSDERSYNSKISRQEVPLPEDVKDEALQKFIATLTVTI